VHAGPAPHWQAPAAEQVSVLPAAQVTQARPPLPQLAGDVVRHALPAQQPFGHENASQTQTPPAQRCPAAQAGPAPHAHAPAGVHPSAIAESHATQAAPEEPQRASELDTQVAPSQHPLGQLVALHTQPPLHV
jgi:hypothetical protein